MAKDFIIRKEGEHWIGVASFREYFSALGDGKYKISVTKADKRTLSQNNWFHSVLGDIKNALRNVGYNEIRTDEDAKDFVKSMFFKEEMSNGIDTVAVVRGTSEVSKLDFASKAEDIIIWAQQYLGIDIAPPGKQFEFFE